MSAACEIQSPVRSGRVWPRRRRRRREAQGSRGEVLFLGEDYRLQGQGYYGTPILITPLQDQFVRAYLPTASSRTAYAWAMWIARCVSHRSKLL